MHQRRWATAALCAFLPTLVMTLHSAPPAAVEAAGLGAPAVLAEAPAGHTPETYRGSFFYTSSGAMLQALGVKVYPEDKVSAFPDPILGIGSTITIYRAQAVEIADAGSVKTVRTWAKTVGDLLDEQRISLGDSDIVQPDRGTLIPVGNGTVIVSITRVQENQAVESEPVAFTVKKVDDPELEKGKTTVEQAGVTGLKQRTYLVRRENGTVVSRQLVKTEVVKQPVDQVVHVGTKVINYGTGGASWYGGVPALTAAHKTLPMGTMVKVVNVANGKSVVVRINDRGPFVAGRIIDLSSDAFAQIAGLGQGVAQVRLEQP